MRRRMIAVLVYVAAVAASVAGGVCSLHSNWLLTGTILPALLLLGCLAGIATGRRWSHRIFAAICCTLVMVVISVATANVIRSRIELLACTTYQNVGPGGGFTVAVYDFTCARYRETPDQVSDEVAMFTAKNCWYWVQVRKRGGHVWAWMGD